MHGQQALFHRLAQASGFGSFMALTQRSPGSHLVARQQGDAAHDARTGSAFHRLAQASGFGSFMALTQRSPGSHLVARQEGDAAHDARTASAFSQTCPGLWVWVLHGVDTKKSWESPCSTARGRRSP